MANDWKEKMASEFVAIAKDPANTEAVATAMIADRLNTLVLGVLDKSKVDHLGAAKEEAAKQAAAQKARDDEAATAVGGEPAAAAEASGQARTAGGTFAPRTKAWAASSTIASGDKAKLSGGVILTATTGGTTGPSEPTVSDVTDGSVVWKVG